MKHADDHALELCKRAEGRHSGRAQLLDFWQEVAEQFAPWHADFTTELQWGTDYAAHLMESTPLLVARTFQDQIASILRPEGKQYLWYRTGDEELNEQPQLREYMDWRSKQLMRIVFDRMSGAHRALKTCDGFFAIFGQGVLSSEVAGNRLDRLAISHHHLKTCAWTMGDDDRPATMDRSMQLTARRIKARFPEADLHHDIKEAYEKGSDQTFKVWHHVLSAEEHAAYKKSTLRLKPGQGLWTSIYTDGTNKRILRETPHRQTFGYIVPRWATFDESPYAFSPAVVVALPDARLIQAQATVLLEASEKSASPPLIAQSDTIRGAPDFRANGITWVDRNYDEREGKAVTPLDLGKNVAIGAEALLRTEQMLNKAFYLDVLRLPDTRKTTSTLETQFLIDEYVRAALPLFAPMANNYNGDFFHECDMLLENTTNAFKMREMPDELRDMKMEFSWDNPLSQMVERVEAQKVSEVVQVGEAVAAFEAARAQSRSLQHVDTDKMLVDGVMGVGGARWIRDKEDVEKDQTAQDEAMQADKTIEQAPNIASTIDSGVKAAQAAADIPEAAEPSFPMLPAPG